MKKLFNALARLLINTEAPEKQAAPLQREEAPVPRETKLYACGGEVRVLDAETDRVLGFRSTLKEARVLQRALENGLHLQSA